MFFQGRYINIVLDLYKILHYTALMLLDASQRFLQYFETSK